REQAADWLREQRSDVRVELESEIEGWVAAGESERITERDEAAQAMKEALERVERAEAESAETERSRADAERKVREDAERRLAEHTEHLKAQIEALESETEDRVGEAV